MLEASLYGHFSELLGNLWQVPVFTEVKGEMEISVNVVNYKF